MADASDSEKKGVDVLIIDNYDSFTYNLYQYICELDAGRVVVHRNDQISVEECERLCPSRILISPGPGTPKEAGISKDVIRTFAGRVPILGVCLGHQSMFEVYGGTIINAGEIMHGKTSMVHHDGKGLFEGLSEPFPAVRYHSLVGDKATLPEVLEVSATLDSGMIMGVRHREFTVEGVQFHPESILTEHGKHMLRNFLRWEGGSWR
mmetsp:Transcript_15319/g.48891  ORF Transcript_15319/g.48891 Transcript_15319/m.48891 type:complete len:207 (-) Transcript_15319:744-1364(-)